MNQVISVIVPIYNAGDALDNCIKSIVEQSYRNLDIVLIDDGSTDGSSKCCDEWAERDQRIRVYHQQNQGVSIARNLGLQKIIGEYVMFVDADDYINKEICKVLIDYMIENDCEITIANKVFHVGTSVIKNTLYKQDSVIRVEDKDLFQLDLLTHKYDPLMNEVKYLSCGVTAKLFSTNIIKNKNLRFVEACHWGEDVIFNLNCFEHANKIGYINYDGYNFRVNTESSTHRFRLDWKETQELFIKCLDDFVEHYNKDQRFHDAVKMMKASRISSLAVSFYFHRDNPFGFWKNYISFKKFVKSPQYFNAIKSVSKELLTKKQRIIVSMIQRHMYLLVACVSWGSNRRGGNV